jgi:prepilin-type N-terminal cleavage/methylation domain-containing protein
MVKKHLMKVKEGIKAGFTLMELMVAVGIFVLLTSVAFYGYADFNNNITMTNQAYELSLHVRQAQIYGIAVRGDITGADPDFEASYGFHASQGSNMATIFRDNDADGVYTETEPILERLTLAQRVRVCAICAITTGTSFQCENAYENLYITFRRPDPDARIDINDTATAYAAARVVVQAPNGKERFVDVTSTGQISVRIPDPEEAPVCLAP